MPIQITAEPIDDRRCKFILDRAVHPSKVRKYTSVREAGDSPVIQALFGMPAVCEVIASGNVLTVVQYGSLPWSVLEPQVRYAIGTALGQMIGAPSASTTSAALDDDAVYHTVSVIFESEINPTVAQHGGKVELIDVQEGTVVLRMMGGCQGCGMANVTLRQGIEAALKRQVPSLRGIRDITDHAAGTNPYFEAATK